MEIKIPEKHKEFFRKLKALLMEYGAVSMYAHNGETRIKFEEITSDRTEVYYSVDFEGDGYFWEGVEASLDVIKHVRSRRDVEL